MEIFKGNIMKVLILSLMIVFESGIFFPMASKISDIPMSASVNLDIRDGEFLHYSFYAGGEKASDIYYVSRLSGKGSEGRDLIYFQAVKSGSDKILPKNYSNFSAHYLISISRGSLLEALGNFDPESARDRLENVPTGYQGLFSWNYLMDMEKHVILYEDKTLNDNEIKVRKSRININPAYSYWDSMSGMFFSVRFMNIKSPGVFYFVIPEALKEPIAITYKILGSETVITGAGTFQTYKIGFVSADPFLAKLLDTFTKIMIIWVEKSDRHLVVKMQLPAGTFRLESISNVIQ